MPRCQHENSTVEINLSQHLFAFPDSAASRPITEQIRLAVTCKSCRFVGVYRAYKGNEAAGDPQYWPKWLLRRVTVLRDQSLTIEAACTDLSVPRLSAPEVAA